MSRGFGRIEREIIEALDLFNLGRAGPELAEWITGATNSPSVRRALKKLEAKGVIVPLSERYGRSIIWVLTKATKNKLRRERRQEKNRARQQKHKDETHQKYEKSWAADNAFKTVPVTPHGSNNC